mmetsp:Transcript_16353/g.31773  ORF Transcript_16353/g.31773 Transcript_16353/m.31773 type:complete len:170 (-) Transcript_16353:312-821(-)|eukprot:CAMPEP_0171497912 /NCGR_PEP_ID=MMETSP0958-20121227/7544_1 /TAXON_ID=87120 /ORGANISM="Aurantiochytrium limacinum, Strain ATCCMYA-1381" /LENGTH=169 /DNA_ID=CAMNT_0012032225 /DNA_START=306 /DNA_END=815 /DNA_ORIENTATION=+
MMLNVVHKAAIRSAASAPLCVGIPARLESARGFARRRGHSKKPFDEPEDALTTTSSAPPPATAEKDPWQPVTDKQTGLVYWWNTETNETTALGMPKPGSEGERMLQQQQEQQAAQYQQPSLGRTMAEGAAFGVGAGMGRSLFGSFFGGGGDSGSNDDGGFSGGDDGGWV